MSKAFHSWKMASQKQSKSGKLKATVFAEPQLPWNVRHPNSRVTGLWESAQAVLLIYVAFTVPFWMCFNIELVRWESKWWFDLFVDLFFLADIFLNMHTAYWDKSGELRGVTQGGAGQGPVADLEAMYRHYARGWMGIDGVRPKRAAGLARGMSHNVTVALVGVSGSLLASDSLLFQLQ